MQRWHRRLGMEARVGGAMSKSCWLGFVFFFMLDELVAKALAVGVPGVELQATVDTNHVGATLLQVLKFFFRGFHVV